MIHPCSYALLQTIQSQSSNKYQNQLTKDCLIILPTSTFSTKANAFMTLKNSSYKQTLEYTPPKSKPKHSNRNITWFILPYNKCIISNI